MRRALLAAFAAALLLAAPAPATTIRVQVTKDGFSPANVTLHAGDSIGWFSSDGDHRLDCKTCRFTSYTLKEHGSYGFTFLHPGSFKVVDQLNGDKTATITVKPALASVEVAGPTSLAYGKTATITGRVSSHRAGEKVEILAQRCIEPKIRVTATVKSTKGGAFSYHARPTQVTSFHARYDAPSGLTVSPTVRVFVAPIITLKKLAAGKFSVRVTAGTSLFGRSVMFQRYARAQHRWVTSKIVVLEKQSTSSAPLKHSSVSSTVVKTKLGKGTKVRALLRSFQALPCYAAAWSRTTTI